MLYPTYQGAMVFQHVYPVVQQPAYPQAFHQSQVGWYWQANQQFTQPYQWSGQHGYQVVQQPAQYFQVVPGNPYSQYPWAIQPSTVPYSLAPQPYWQDPFQWTSFVFPAPTMITCGQPQLGTVDHQPPFTSNSAPTPDLFDNTTSFDNATGSLRQIKGPQPEAKKSKIYYFDMNKDSRKPDKIIFNLNEMNKENVKPFFIDYFKTNSFFESIKGREERYTEALVFEQKIKEIGHHFNEIDLAQLSKPETLLKLTEFGGKTAVLKDSSDAEHHKIIEILKNNKENPSFIESIKETLNEGIALQNKSDYHANQLRIALIKNNLKKEEAGQIAKAISILDNQFISQSKPSRSVSEHIDKLFNYHSPSPNPKYPTNHIASGVIAHQ